jgi:hypothetical protein
MKRFSFDMLLIFLSTAVLLAAACFVVGPTLGLFFAGIILAAMLAPFIAMIHADWSSHGMSVGVACEGIALVWLVTVVGGSVSLWQWLSCYVLLLCFTFAVAGVAWLARSLGLHANLASAFATITALAWLAAPIWMSANVSPSIMQRMTAAHPLIAINGVVAHLGIWTEQPMMYRLSSLGQDVAYQFPSAWLVAAIHAVIGLVLLGAAMALRRSHAPCDRQSRSTPLPAPTTENTR